MSKKFLGVLSLSLASIMLTACSDDDDDKKTRNLSVSPSLGVVEGTPVNVYGADGVTLLATGVIGDSGVVELPIPLSSFAGPKVLVVEGGADAMYFDEALGTKVSFPAGQSMRALVPSGLSEVAVTPLTEVAFKLAEAQSLFPISASAVNQLNDIVRNSLAPAIDSILTPPTLAGSGSVTSFADDNAGRYALVLAALAELGGSSGSPALTVLNALAQDAVDGAIDGQANGASINAPYRDFKADMVSALNTAAQEWSFSGNSQAQAPASNSVDASSVENSTDSSGDDNTSGGDSSGGDSSGGDSSGGDSSGGDSSGGDSSGGDSSGGDSSGGDSSGGDSSGGDSSGGTSQATACFNPSLHTIGTKVDQVFTSTDSSSGVTIQTTSNSEFIKNTTYNGNDAVEAKAIVTADASDDTFDSQSTTFTYSKLGNNNNSMFVYGTVTEASSFGFTFTTSTTIDPYREDRYNLNVGDSYTQTYTVNTESSAPGATIPPSQITSKTTYLGRENVTVPAGTFNACKFKIESQDSSTMTWTAPGNGISLKTVSGNTETVLNSASINGTPISGN